ncbi:mce related family protein [Yersinia pseudotuberculosis]|uniref:PqiB family protein n=1 Tax=Yersinia pseudotuberculosis TaxID=633 RepID=UPI00017398FD|nr:PqiB family protein [Yersinia pseudotuberculosis]CQD49469.1 mce-like protein [Yersinia intermedia]AJJ01475.1 mce related family protein [Yersinia pseudotuberculosis]AJJ65702.1 mce related family protein [Yersinia pseudotuberculosis PB1/+]AYX13939.1 PqiB family protein [Yersinia pseudotuberculosis]MBO1605610.1 MCE family protein [Yersinia pseudotuberculosis]
MQQETPSTPTEAHVKHKRRFSPFWLLPFIALLITGWLIYNNWQERGTEITIDFQSTAGIVAGRTPIRYQGVDVGLVQSIRLDDNLRNIKVTASIKNDMEDSLREGTQFWLVTPKASLAGVSGLDALVGGNYIGMMPGEGKPQSHFTALDTQPKFRLNTGELMIHLSAPDLGSLNNGSLVYYRKIPVGKVYDYTIAPDNNGVIIDVLIDRRFANLVKKDSRFWNVSGFKADFSLSGASVQMESLAALVNGAIAFDSPQNSQDAAPDQPFQLYSDLAHSQRGVAITLDLPGGSHLSEGRTPLIYQGLQVGTLTKMTLQPDQKVTGELTIDPSVVNLMRSGTRIEMNSPRISLSNANVSELLTGNTLELIPGDGEPQQHFTVLPSSKSLLQQPNALELQLTAPQSYGIDVGQPISLRGIKIGQVLTRELSADGVTFTAAIEAKYRHLVHKDSKFVANSRLDVNVGIDGVNVQGASAQEWIDGGILLLSGSKGEVSGSKGEALKQYPLYSSVAKATDGILGSSPATTLTLTASSLPDIQAGSVVLYRKFQVGEITHVRPKANAFEVDVYIQPEYRNLLTEKSIFWSEGGAKVQLSGSGLTVQASPLNRALKGAISFDNLEGVTLDKGAKRTLYSSETAARAVGSQIILRTFDASKLSAGMPIRYLGIDIGQVESLKLAPERNEVLAKAVLYPEYVQNFTRAGTRFSIVSPEISAAGVNNLETLFQPYINVEPGKGGPLRNFELQTATITDSRYLDGLSIILDTAEAGSLQVGTPVLFRGLEVGTVTGFNLGAMSDRVQVSLRISQKFQHLVRQNTVFWLASGYNFEFGLIGGVVKSGTFQQFIRGGIAFATPPTIPLAPRANVNQHFLLAPEEPKDWRKWGTAIPRS